LNRLLLRYRHARHREQNHCQNSQVGFHKPSKRPAVTKPANFTLYKALTLPNPARGGDADVSC
jgi:hypothetical protein